MSEPSKSLGDYDPLIPERALKAADDAPPIKEVKPPAIDRAEMLWFALAMALLPCALLRLWQVP